MAEAEGASTSWIGPLAGRRILVTRPGQQALRLAERIAAQGGVPQVFPLLHIEALHDYSERDQAIAILGDCRLVVFVSPNAVAHSVPAILAYAPWPAHVPAVAVGAGTARELAELGVPEVLTPEGEFDSEGLLALPQLSADAVQGKRVVIFRGDGGRELLADSLRDRGAVVDCITCYRRRPPTDYLPLNRWLAAEEIDAFSVSSSEALGYLFDGTEERLRARLAALPLFTSHPRIAGKAAALGCSNVVLTPVGDAGLVDALCVYNWPLPLNRDSR